MADDRAFSLEGACTCGAVRYRMTSKPMFVHCCHCRWCQRETGASFALNAMIEADRVILLKASRRCDTPRTAKGTEDRPLPDLPYRRYGATTAAEGCRALRPRRDARRAGSPAARYPHLHLVEAALGRASADMPAVEEYYERDKYCRRKARAPSQSTSCTSLPPGLRMPVGSRKSTSPPGGPPTRHPAAEYLASLSVDKREAMWRESIVKGVPQLFVAKVEDDMVGWVAFAHVEMKARPRIPPRSGPSMSLPLPGPAGLGACSGTARKRACSNRGSRPSGMGIHAERPRNQVLSCCRFVPDLSSVKEFELAASRCRRCVTRGA